VLLGKVIVMILTAVLVPVAASFISSHTADIEMNARIMKIGWWVTVILLLWQVITFLIAMMRLQSTLYTITSQRVVFEQGLLSKNLSEIDLRSVDDTQFFQSFMERLLGIGNVSLVSSDKALPMTMLRGVPDPRKLRELIRSRAYQVSQRQVFTRAT
jgi:uncharacterized membrane protein YdbT with pleckstrin-like domain